MLENSSSHVAMTIIDVRKLILTWSLFPVSYTSLSFMVFDIGSLGALTIAPALKLSNIPIRLAAI